MIVDDVNILLSHSNECTQYFIMFNKIKKKTKTKKDYLCRMHRRTKRENTN